MRRKTVDLRIRHDIFMEKEMFLLVSKFGAESTHVLVLLWSIIAGTDGWELDYDEETLLLLEDRMKVSKSKIQDILEYSTKRGNSYIRITKDNKLRSTVLEADMLKHIITWRTKQHALREKKKKITKDLGNKKLLIGMN